MQKIEVQFTLSYTWADESLVEDSPVFGVTPDIFYCVFYEDLEYRSNYTELQFETPKLNSYD